MITASNLYYSFGKTAVIKNVSLTMQSGKVLGLIGPNGSGKTTLLRMLYGSLKPTSGGVFLNGSPLHSWSPRKIAQHIAVVVQHIEGETMLTTEEMVQLGRIPHGRIRPSTAKIDQEIVRWALQRAGVSNLARRPFTALSGGERQRTLIARALAQETEILLMDEPTNHLDIRYQHELLHLMRSLGRTCVLVLHDLNLAAQYCDELILLDRGSIHAHGLPHEVVTKENIENVYQIATHRTVVNGHINLVFEPMSNRSNFHECDEMLIR